MRSPFVGYYPPSDQEFEQLWKNAMIVFDTNVLLNLYRLPITAREDLLKVMRLLEDRVWLPHQVALEFQRRRLTVIASERKTTEDALSYANGLMDEIKKRFDRLQLDKRALGVKSDDLLKELNEAHQELITALKAAHDQQLDISSSDPIRDAIDKLFSDRVGDGPRNQLELDAILKDADSRYAANIPPGYMDQDKDKNPNEASFIFDKIIFQRKYGDLILWRQILAHSKANQIRQVLLITADKKEDWWWREQGRTIGPHPELVREIMSQGDVELFWMYSSDQFVEQATKFLKTEISGDSVSEIKNVSRSTSFPTMTITTSRTTGLAPSKVSQSGFSSFRHDTDIRAAEECVEIWLRDQYGDAVTNQSSFPDFVAETENGIHGFDVKYLRHFDKYLFSPVVINTMLRGYMEVNEDRLSAFSLVAVIPEDSFFTISSGDGMERLALRLARLLAKYPITEIIVGSRIDDRFLVLLRQSERLFEE